jgi:hypothetical protein
MKSPVMSQRCIASMYRIDISQHNGSRDHGARRRATLKMGGGRALAQGSR